MRIYNGLSEITIEKGSSLVLGKFESLHLGHRLLIKEMLKRSQGLTSCVLRIRIPGNADIISDAEFNKSLERLGVDTLINLDLNPEIMDMAAEEFLKTVLFEKLKIQEIVAGPDVSFGKGARGNAEFLNDNKSRYGYRFSIIPKVKYEGEPISTSRIRETLSKGDTAAAEIMLGSRVNAFKGRDLDGVIIIDKPEDFTSQDVISKLRGMLHTKKIGHTGTLDPKATGVLPVLVGKATKLSDRLMSQTKVYEASLKFGVITDTQDIWGRVIEARAERPAVEDIEKALKHFTGVISQIPPMYSAIKINGKKLYDLARTGATVERSPREITIEKIELLDVRSSEIDIRVYCSKGTYIRTLCHDMGLYLGCGAAMSALRRVRSGDFALQRALALNELQEKIDSCECLDGCFLGIEEVLKDIQKIKAPEEFDKALENGNELPPDLAGAYPGCGEFCIYNSKNRLIGIYKIKNGKLKPDIMF